MINTDFKFFTSPGDYKENYLITRMNAVDSATIFFGMPKRLIECSMFEVLRIKDSIYFLISFNSFNKGCIVYKDIDENLFEYNFENEEEFKRILGLDVVNK